MQAIFSRTQFIAKGFKFAIINSLKIIAAGERLSLRPEHDYVTWSYNVRVSYKEPGARRQKSLYMAADRDLLNIYEVSDRSCGESLGVVRYHFGVWEILDNDNNYFTIAPSEDILNELLFLKRIPHLIADAHGDVIGVIKKISPFFLPAFYKYRIDIPWADSARVDRRLVMAALILFIFAHERVGSLEKIKYYIASRLGFKPVNKPFILKKKTVFGKARPRSVVPL